MRIKSLIALAILIGPSSAFAACGDKPDHASQRNCLQHEAAALSRQVEAAQAVLRDRIAAWDQDAAYKDQALALFVSAAKQFRSFTAAQCAFESSAAAGGNGAGDMQLECQISLGKAYLKSLKEQAAWFTPLHA